ncbi:MAG: glycosyltransferase family 4 protein [Cyanobacteria bacterium P01_A01_bin.116]
MEICIVTHKVGYGDGQGRVNYEVTLEALRQGHFTTLLSSEISPDLESHSQVTWVPIKVANWPTELARNIAFSIQCASWLRQHRAKFDLIQVNGAITSTPADVNAVHFVHSAWLRSPVHTFRVRRNLYGAYQWLYTALNARWEKRAFQRSRSIVAVSDKIAQELISIGVSPQRVKVIVNGVDGEEFVSGPVNRSSLGLPEDVTLALFAGDIQTPRKNLDTVLLALAQLPSLHLAIAGRTEGSPYPKMANQLGITQQTHFLGYRRDMPALMKAADFFVFPSRYEACTLVLLEAMASGLPVITATTAGGAELVTSESGIVLSDPNDVETLAQAMANLIGDTKLRERMGQAARSTAKQHSWATMAEQYLQLFETMHQHPDLFKICYRQHSLKKIKPGKKYGANQITL